MDQSNQQATNLDALENFNAFDTNQAAATETKQPQESGVGSSTNNEVNNDEIVFDEPVFLKNNFGWDTVDAGKSEIERLRNIEKQYQEIQNTTQHQQIKFDDPESEKVFNYIKDKRTKELYQYLDTQERLSAVDSLSSQDKIKLSLQLQNKHYKPEDVNDIWEEKYSLPSKPIKEDDESDIEYQSRVNQYQATVDKVNRRIDRDAYDAAQQLQKMKSEIILPDIKTGKDTNEAAGLSQEDLAKLQATRDIYLQKLESDFKTFSGFKSTFKDKDVEFEVNYSVPENEQAAYKEKLKNFDLVSYFESRWWNQDGTPKVNQMMEDLYQLENKEKVFQKFVTDAAGQRLEQHVKLKKNIHINNGGSSSQQDLQTTTMEKAFQELGEVAFSVR